MDMTMNVPVRLMLTFVGVLELHWDVGQDHVVLTKVPPNHDLLEVLLSIDWIDTREEMIIVMITKEKPFLSWETCPESIEAVFITKHNVTQVIDLILWGYSLGPIMDHEFIHFGAGIEVLTTKWDSIFPFEVQYVGMTKVGV